MIPYLRKKLGYETPEQIIGFLISGMMILPPMLFLDGERNAAAVVMLVLVNVLLVFGIRAREIENLKEKNETADRRAPDQSKAGRRDDS